MAKGKVVFRTGTQAAAEFKESIHPELHLLEKAIGAARERPLIGSTFQVRRGDELFLITVRVPDEFDDEKEDLGGL